MLVPLVASIPSPSSNGISIGPVDLRAYGILIAIGVLAGVWLASRRLAQDGLDPDIVPNLALWVLPAALIGARAYFVLTNWGRFSDDAASAFRLWEGGLGIPGGVALGMAVGVWWLRRQQVPLAPVFTAVALGLPLGQIIGRFGNWFNQELYGRPTELPWGLEIDPAHRLPGYEANELFHPTFAYEILWNIGLLAVLLWIDGKRVLKPGALFAVYLIGYGIGRILIELVRIDPVNELFGIRLHIWAMVAFILAAAHYLYRHGSADTATATAPAGTTTGDSTGAGDSGDRSGTEAAAGTEAEEDSPATADEETGEGERSGDEPAAQEPGEPEDERSSEQPDGEPGVTSADASAKSSGPTSG